MSETRSENISILLAIPQDSLCNGIRTIFAPFNDIQIVEELNSFENLVDSVKTHSPAILLISISEWDLYISNVLKTIKISYPEISVIIMLENFEDEMIYTALGLSAGACLTTNAPSDELITCIRKVYQGENPIFDTLTRPGIARLILKGMEHDLNSAITEPTDTRKTLSDQEREILQSVGDDYTLDQIILNLSSCENDLIQHLTDIYGKLIFNNFCEFSVQPSEKPVKNDKSTDESLADSDTNTQTTDLHTLEVTTEKDDGIDENDIYSEYNTTAWEGFEALKRELQETLNRLALNDGPAKFLKEIHEESPDIIEEEITENTNIDERIFEVVLEPSEHNLEDFEMIDQEYDSESGKFSEEMESTGKDNMPNSESDTNRFMVDKNEESGNISQDKLVITEKSEIKENKKTVKQKSQWFRFSLRRNNKASVKTDRSSENNVRSGSTVISEKPESHPREELITTKKNIPNKTKEGDKYTTQPKNMYSQQEISSSVKGIGVPVFIKTPVDGKQLEKLESTIKKINNLNIVLRKGTAQEHVLVISGQDPANLLTLLNDIPVVESTSDEKGMINIKLLPVTGRDDPSQVQ